MAMRRTGVMAGCLTLFLTGCGAISLPSGSFDKVKGITTTAEYRLVREQEGPNGNRIVCTEPSPDIAKAISEALKASGSSNGVSAALEFQRNESIAQLGKRYATVQLLREMMYRDCELYGNGIINQVEYAMKLSRFDAMVVTLLGIEMASSESASASSTTPDKPAGDPSAAINKVIDGAAADGQKSDAAVEKMETSVTAADKEVKASASTITDAIDATKAFNEAKDALVLGQRKVDAAIILVAAAKNKADATIATTINAAKDAVQTAKQKAQAADVIAGKAAANANITEKPKTAIASAKGAIAEASKQMSETSATLEKLPDAIKKAGDSQESGTAKGSTISNAQATVVQEMQKAYLSSQGLGPVTVACAMALDRSPDKRGSNVSMGLLAIRSGIASLPRDRKVSLDIKNLFDMGLRQIKTGLASVENKDMKEVLETGLAMIQAATNVSVDSVLPVENQNRIEATLHLMDDSGRTAWFTYCNNTIDRIVFWKAQKVYELELKKLEKGLSSEVKGPESGSQFPEPGSQMTVQ